jgi:hypothetical protein
LKGHHVNCEGYVEKLYVNVTGQAVKKGQPLLTIYSPELVASQQEFLTALIMAKSVAHSTDPSIAEGGKKLIESAHKRLKLWDISEQQINRLEATGEIEVSAENVEILNAAEPLPLELDESIESTEDVRLKYRFLDLRKPRMQKNLTLRHKVCQAIREFLDKEGFIVVYPNGCGKLPNRFLTWNAGFCCGYSLENDVDDVGFYS